MQVLLERMRKEPVENTRLTCVEMLRKIATGAHLLYWYKSTCFLVQEYLLAGTKVQTLIPESRLE
jgi:hypothetical protein